MPEENGTGGENEGGGGEENATELQKEVETLKGQLGELETAKSENANKIKEYEDVLMSDDYAEFVESKKSGNEGEGNESSEGGDDTDLEKINSFAPAQLAEFLSDKFGGKLDEIAKQSDKKFEDLTTALVGQLARVNLEFTKVKHSNSSIEPGGKSLEEKLDAKDYYDHFTKVATDNPTWDGEKVYKQVEMEIAANAHSQNQKEEAKKVEEGKATTEKATETPLSTVKGKRLSKGDAVDVACEQSFGTSGVSGE